MTHTYILVDPNDDSGNDDGVLDKVQMTEAEAEILNRQRRKVQNDLRWIKERRKYHHNGHYSGIYSEDYFD